MRGLPGRVRRVRDPGAGQVENARRGSIDSVLIHDVTSKGDIVCRQTSRQPGGWIDARSGATRRSSQNTRVVTTNTAKPRSIRSGNKGYSMRRGLPIAALTVLLVASCTEAPSRPLEAEAAADNAISGRPTPPQYVESHTWAACADDEVLCSHVCSRLLFDRLNCGECGIACGVGNECVHGHCMTGEPQRPVTDEPYAPATDTRCPPDRNACGGRCVDLATDPDHCGACGRHCSGGCYDARCAEGV